MHEMEWECVLGLRGEDKDKDRKKLNSSVS